MMVEQIVTLDFASIDNEFLGVTICSTTLSAMCYLYNIACLLVGRMKKNSLPYTWVGVVFATVMEMGLPLPNSYIHVFPFSR